MMHGYMALDRKEQRILDGEAHVRDILEAAPEEQEGFETFMERYRPGLEIGKEPLMLWAGADKEEV